MNDETVTTPTVKTKPEKVTVSDLALGLNDLVLHEDTDYDFAKAAVAVIANYLASNNKRFDRSLFFAACGVNPRG